MSEHRTGAQRHPNVRWRAAACVLAIAATTGLGVASLASNASAAPTPSSTATTSATSSSAASSASASAPAAPASTASPAAISTTALENKPKATDIKAKPSPKSTAASTKRNSAKAAAAASPTVTFAGASYDNGVVTTTFKGSGFPPGGEGADLFIPGHACPTRDPGDTDCFVYSGQQPAGSSTFTLTFGFNASTCSGKTEWESSSTDGATDYGSGDVTWDNCAPANHAPHANNDTATTDENTATTIDVLANDTDKDGDKLSVATFGQPTHGTTALKNNEIVYTPASGFSGTDSFTYTAGDGKAGSNTATVFVTVKPVVVPPPCTKPTKGTFTYSYTNGTLVATPTSNLCKQALTWQLYQVPSTYDGKGFDASSAPQTRIVQVTKTVQGTTPVTFSVGLGNVKAFTDPANGNCYIAYQLDLQNAPGQTTVEYPAGSSAPLYYAVGPNKDQVPSSICSPTPTPPKKAKVEVSYAVLGSVCGDQNATETVIVGGDLDKVKVDVVVNGTNRPLTGDRFYVTKGQHYTITATVKDQTHYAFAGGKESQTFSGTNAEKSIACPAPPKHNPAPPAPKPVTPRNPDYNTNATGPTGTSSILPGWVWGFITFGGIAAVGLGALNKRRRHATPRSVQG